MAARNKVLPSPLHFYLKQNGWYTPGFYLLGPCHLPSPSQITEHLNWTSLSHSWRWDQWTPLTLHMPASFSRQCSSNTTAWDLAQSRPMKPSNANWSLRYAVSSGSLIKPELNRLCYGIWWYDSVKTATIILSNICIFLFSSQCYHFSGVWMPLSVMWNDVRYQSAFPLTEW